MIDSSETARFLNSERSSLRMVAIIVRRELRDTLRDWRIVTPIVALTLIFPWLMNWTAQAAVEFVEKRNATIIGERFIPFLLMIVGFFPISFSLVIALETFVGEKERRSIEPLLSMPITDLELYLGKMLAATALPLMGSLLGISVYLAGLYGSLRYVPPVDLLIQIFLLNILTAWVMVAGAVVVSSQTTSVRAANLLASFIIVPMALLIQAESVVMFWGHRHVLWVIALGLVVISLILVRMGIRTFNREEILGREIDELNVRRLVRVFFRFLVDPPEGILEAKEPGTASRLVRLGRWIARVYGRDLPRLLRLHRMPVAAVGIFVIVAVAIGWAYVPRFPFPPGLFRLEDLTFQHFESLPDLSFLPSLTPGGIFLHNLRMLALAGLAAVISLGVLAVLMLMVSMALVGFFTGQVAWLGYNPWIFLASFILPHGLLELPAAIIATAFALRLGVSMVAPRPGLSVGEGLIAAAADLVKVFLFLVAPLLMLAALVEVYLTPQIVVWVYGG